MKLIPFNADATPLASFADFLDINAEVVSVQGFPTLSIKGKVFTINKDRTKTIVTKPGEDEDEVAQSMGLVFLRANQRAKTYYAKGFTEGDSDHARPECYSLDGVAPSINSSDPQSPKCAICPHNQWGSAVDDAGNAREGKRCQDNARIAVSVPGVLDPMLLRVPPTSLKALKDLFVVVLARKTPYNAIVVKVGFDPSVASPRLTFKPVGTMDPNGPEYAAVREVYDSELVRAIVGLDDFGSGQIATLHPRIEAPAAKAISKPAPVEIPDYDADEAPAPKPKVAVKPVVKVKVKAVEVPDDDAPAPKAKVAPKAKAGASSLMDELDELLGNKDD